MFICNFPSLCLLFLRKAPKAVYDFLLRLIHPDNVVPAGSDRQIIDSLGATAEVDRDAPVRVFLRRYIIIKNKRSDRFSS